MGWFTDILSGGPKLHRRITPSWARDLAPREIQPGGFNPGRDWLGVDLDGTLADEQRAKEAGQLVQLQQQYGGQFDQSASAPVPGVPGTPLGNGANIPGFMPTAPTGGASAFSTPFQASGQYGLLAQQLAGVSPQNQQGPNMQIPQQQIPMTQAQGLLGGPKRGFRIPGGLGGK